VYLKVEGGDAGRRKADDDGCSNILRDSIIDHGFQLSMMLAIPAAAAAATLSNSGPEACGSARV
jgi:hypothetical protein